MLPLRQLQVRFAGPHAGRGHTASLPAERLVGIRQPVLLGTRRHGEPRVPRPRSRQRYNTRRGPVARGSETTHACPLCPPRGRGSRVPEPPSGSRSVPYPASFRLVASLDSSPRRLARPTGRGRHRRWQDRRARVDAGDLLENGKASAHQQRAPPLLAEHLAP